MLPACSKLQNIKRERIPTFICSLCNSSLHTCWVEGRFGSQWALKVINVTCCRHCTSKTQRPFDMSQLWTVLFYPVTTACVQTLAETEDTNTLKLECTQTHKFIAAHLYLKHCDAHCVFVVFMPFVPLQSVEHLFCSVIKQDFKMAEREGDRLRACLKPGKTLRQPSYGWCAIKSHSN